MLQVFTRFSIFNGYHWWFHPLHVKHAEIKLIKNFIKIIVISNRDYFVYNILKILLHNYIRRSKLKFSLKLSFSRI